MTRALALVLDSVGIGGAADAHAYGDAGADTVGHIAQACARGAADRRGVREGPLRLPHLVGLGLGEACRLASGRVPPGLETQTPPRALHGCAAEVSKGKDTPSGHWEIAGLPVPFAWGHFPRTVPCFPRELVAEICRHADASGTLGDCHASGTEIIETHGEDHMRTGRPIVYTSADSVIQIAAHEGTFGLARLYALCAALRPAADRYRIGRVIARPFVGAGRGAFVRTAHRRDFAVPPPSPTLLDAATAEGRDVVTVGKIADIFAHSGTGRVVRAHGDAALFDAMCDAAADLPSGGLLFANFVDFDTEYGHRRDVAGYATALEAFDARLERLEALLRPGDLLVITADHGCDPTWSGSDHTREQVPVLAFSPRLGGRSIGRRRSFADVGASVAQHLGLKWRGAGTSFLSG